MSTSSESANTARTEDSVNSEDFDAAESKFTRGEKCIFIHLIVTFSIILLLAIIYFVHLCLVSHSLRDVFKISRRVASREQFIGLEKLPVGLIYLSEAPLRYICNSLLLSRRWSVAPGHCAAMRTDPDLSHLLYSWRVKYRGSGNKFVGSEVKRTIPHPNFDRDDFRNNIGLIEHGDIRGIDYHVCERLKLKYYKVQPVTTTKCIRFMSPILDMRPYEFCFLLEQAADVNPDHGSVLIVNSKIMGFFAWGERTGKGTPSVILDLKYFKNWLESISW